MTPADIRDTYPKTEETFSLRTKDPREALRRVRIAAVEVDGRFEAHRRELARAAEPMLNELTDDQIRHIGDVYYAFRLEEDFESRVDEFFVEGGPIPELPKPTFEEFVEDIEAADENLRHLFARGIVDPFFADEAREVLTWTNVDIRLNPGSPSWRLVALALQAATIRAYEAIKERNLGKAISTPKMPERASKPETAGILLSVAVDKWVAEKSRGSWVPKTAHEHRTWMGHFIAVAGDRPLGDYRRADAREFKDILLRLPANWNKQAALGDLTVPKAAEKARELGLPPMSESNVNKLIGFVGSFWTWARENYDEAPENPFRGLKMRLSRNVREERDPFALSELQSIFRAPVYTGCRSLARWKEAGDLVPRDAGMFWVPLIGLFTGARLGEIVQLYTGDIREAEGVSYFDINADGDDKTLKNPQSKRRIPVHPQLVEAGFIAFVEKRRKEGAQRLFPDLQRGADGYYSSPFSKYFGRFLRAVGVKSRRNAFHSFRHSFEDACRSSGIAADLMNALEGHVEPGMAGRYGKGFGGMLPALSKAIETLRYDGLDLRHLAETAGALAPAAER